MGPRPRDRGAGGRLAVRTRLGPRRRPQRRDEVASVFTDEELARIVQDSSDAGLLQAAESQGLRDALELGTRTVKEILVPASHMVTVDHRVTPRQLEQAAATSGYSRFPVIAPGGAVLGILHVKDALEFPDRDKPMPREALRPVVPVRLDTPLDRLAGRTGQSSRKPRRTS
jgi:CBS domain containing-hemolysin-like protein